jgi:hypothetical protein
MFFQVSKYGMWQPNNVQAWPPHMVEGFLPACAQVSW